MARLTRSWPLCFLPPTVRRRLALDRRLGRVIAAAVFMTILFTLHPSQSQRSQQPHLQPGVPSRVDSHPDIRFRASSFDWRSVTQRYPVSSIRPLPTGQPKQFPRVQHVFSGYVHDAATQRRQRAVRAAFIRNWDSYKKYAWLWDELAPVSAKGRNAFGGWAATLVDSLDTLWIMGLPDEFDQAAAAAAQLDWANTTETAANLFETTIRHLGGLLSAFDLSHEPALLEKARELGDMLYMAFDTPNRMPGFWINFEDAKNGQQVAGTGDPSASPCSLSLEFTRLSQLTGDPKFYDAISRISDFLERTQGQSKLPGMWPKLINFQQERVTDSGFTMGALADSLYEYLPKMSALLGGRLPGYEKMYRAAMETAKEHLLFRPMVSDHDKAGKQVLFVGDAVVLSDAHIEHIAEGQHLSCFTGGMFGLGGKLFSIPDHLAIGERLARGCAWAYDAFPTGLMPEIFGMMPCESGIDGPCPFDEKAWKKHDDKKAKEEKEDGGKMPSKGFKNARDPRYILRPEAIESVFLLYRMTGKDDLRELAWRMFESVMKATETPLGNSAIADVTVRGETTKTDSMEVRWIENETDTL